VTEETGINTIERRIALRLALKLCTGIKSGREQKTDTQRNEINSREELVRNGVVLVNKREM
jgi:hypothetical protein